MKRNGLSVVTTEVYLNKKPIVDLLESGSSLERFSMAGDMFVKELNYNKDMSAWLDAYKKIREYEPRIVEIYGYKKRKIYMKYIKGRTLRRNLNLDAFLEACDIIKNLTIYAKENTFIKENKKGFWFHHDMSPRNFMVEDNTNKVYLIDPDTFDFFSIDGKKVGDEFNPKYNNLIKEI